jgi:hypothetical protein
MRERVHGIGRGVLLGFRQAPAVASALRVPVMRESLGVRITECAIESGDRGPEAWVRVQLTEGDSFTIPISLQGAQEALSSWRDGRDAVLTLELAPKKAKGRPKAPIDLPRPTQRRHS